MNARLTLLACSLGLLLGGSVASAQTVAIAGLYTTGLDSAGVLLGDNKVDANYVITASTAGSGYTGNAYSVKAGSIPVSWTPNTGSARWLVDNKPGGGDGNPTRPSGTFDYTITFTMNAGALLSSVSITGAGAADDSASIYVNGTLVSGQSLSGAGATSSFTLNSANAAFVSGSNTITFRVDNAVTNTATGLLISSFAGTVIIPEVGAFLPVAGALALVAGIKVRQRRRESA